MLLGRLQVTQCLRMERIRVKRRMTKVNLQSLLVHSSSMVCDHKVTRLLNVSSCLPNILFAIIHLSPQLADHRKSKTRSTTDSNKPQVGKSACSNVGDPLNFHGS